MSRQGKEPESQMVLKRPRQEDRLAQCSSTPSMPASITPRFQGIDIVPAICGVHEHMSTWMSSLIDVQDGCLRMVAQRASMGRAHQEHLAQQVAQRSRPQSSMSIQQRPSAVFCLQDAWDEWGTSKATYCSRETVTTRGTSPSRSTSTWTASSAVSWGVWEYDTGVSTSGRRTARYQETSMEEAAIPAIYVSSRDSRTPYRIAQHEGEVRDEVALGCEYVQNRSYGAKPNCRVRTTERSEHSLSLSRQKSVVDPSEWAGDTEQTNIVEYAIISRSPSPIWSKSTDQGICPTSSMFRSTGSMGRRTWWSERWRMWIVRRDASRRRSRSTNRSSTSSAAARWTWQCRDSSIPSTSAASGSCPMR